MGNKKYDFSGWATKNDLLCSDGRTIRQDAFKDCDGKIVPLVWNHQGRTDPADVLGHCLLKNDPKGVRAWGIFNETEKGQLVHTLVDNGDITGLSIWANNLVQKGGDVLHGVIREVSLVLSGANPGATIDVVMQHDSDSMDSLYYYLNGEEFAELKHSDDVEGPAEEVANEEPVEEEKKEEPVEPEAEAKPEENEELEHADKESKEASVTDILDTLTDDQKIAVGMLIESLTKKKNGEASVQHSDDPDDEPDDADDKDDSDDTGEKKSVKEVLDSLTDDQKIAVGKLLETLEEDEEPAKEEESKEPENKEGDTEMKHNVFEGNNNAPARDIRGLFNAAIGDLKRYGSLKDSVMAHAADFGYDDPESQLMHASDEQGPYLLEEDGTTKVRYGMTDIDYLFPDARSLTNVPQFIKRDNGWVDDFMNNTHKSPFSRVKSIFANITADEARAKGYTKGNKKIDEIFTLLKRSTDPQTVYKKQKLDKDDIIDITDFDVVVWMKQEMQVMLKEEIARAALVGDGRSASSDDKISELHIRPIYTDDSLFSIKAPVQVPATADDDVKAKAFIRAAIKARKDYKGAGNPTLYTTADMLTAMLLLEDGLGRALYQTEAELATKLRVKKIVEVPVMENLTRTDTTTNTTYTLAGIIVNPVDYNFGADKGGQTSFFEDFDIDYNQQKYLIEARTSGALVTPYSAIVLEIEPVAASGGNSGETNP